MKSFAEYQGGYLNHLEGIYRAEDRDIAVELAEALGLSVAEMRFTEKSRPILAAHPNADDRDPTNNVIFLYEMPDAQRKVLDLMQQKIKNDAELREAMESYRDKARAMPPIMPHFGLRYGTAAALQAVMDKMKNTISAALKARVGLFEVPAYKPIDGLPDIRQVFVRTDVISIGTLGFEQAIELQVDRAR